MMASQAGSPYLPACRQRWAWIHIIPDPRDWRGAALQPESSRRPGRIRPRRGVESLADDRPSLPLGGALDMRSDSPERTSPEMPCDPVGVQEREHSPIRLPPV